MEELRQEGFVGSQEEVEGGRAAEMLSDAGDLRVLERRAQVRVDEVLEVGGIFGAFARLCEANKVLRCCAFLRINGVEGKYAPDRCEA